MPGSLPLSVISLLFYSFDPPFFFPPFFFGTLVFGFYWVLLYPHNKKKKEKRLYVCDSPFCHISISHTYTKKKKTANMSTVQELQAQLNAMRLQHASEIQAAHATLAKLQQDLDYMQADTDDLEKEEAELYKQFGQSRTADAEPKDNPYKDIVLQALRGLVDCDESKCSSA